MTLTGVEMAARAVTERQAAKPLGPNLVGVVAAVNTTRTGAVVDCWVTLTGIPDQLIPGADCSRVFAADVAELGVSAMVGRRVKVSVTPSNQFYIDYTLGG